MLSFSTPLALLGLVLVPVLRWLHRGGAQRREIRVSRLALWRGADAAVPAGAAPRPPDPAWRRRALLAGLLALALAGPQFADRRLRVTLWVDDSISMLAHGADRQPTPLLVDGLERVRTLFAEQQQADVEVRALSDPWRAFGALDDATVAALRAGAGRLEPAAPPAALLRRDRQQWLLTDGADATLFLWPSGRRPDRVVRVGGVTRNVGLERLSARRSTGDGQAYDLLLKVTNGGTADEKRTVVVTAGAGEAARVAIRLPAGASREIELRVAAAATVRAELQPGDALADDDALALDATPLRRHRVAVDSGCPVPLAAAMAAHPGLAVTAPGASGAELVLDCSRGSAATDLPTIRVVAEHTAVRPRGALRWSGEVAPAHRSDIASDRLWVAARLRVRPGDSVLLAIGDDPVVVRRSGPGRRLETSFDFAAIAAARGPELPLLVNAMVEAVLDRSVLDPIAIVDRGPRAASVVPLPDAGAAGADGGGTTPAVAATPVDGSRFLLLSALAVLLWEIAALVRRRSASGRFVGALALQAAACVALAATVLGAAWLDPHSRPRWLVLVDRSQSVPRAVADRAFADIASAVGSAGGALKRRDFAGRPATPAPPGQHADADLEVSATDVEAALAAALAAHAQTALTGLVVVSDGHENRGDAARALQAVREAKLPVLWAAVTGPAPQVRVAAVLAPAQASVGQRIDVSVQLAGAFARPLRIEAGARNADASTQSSGASVATDGRAAIALDARDSGTLRVDLTLRDATSGAVIEQLPDAAVVHIAPAAAILYAQASAQGAVGTYAQSLLRGGWALDVVGATRLDALARSLDAYRAVVLDDVAITDAGPGFWNALVAAVRERGIGLVVLGGERSFARGGYRGSTLESVLPVVSEPAALERPTSVAFAVDKSGSMGAGSGGVDRFRLAQRAVLETARSLGARDAFGLVAFDVVPRVLIPLGPAADGIAALERDWRVTPAGGTRIAPAIEAAIAELERSGAGRRMLVVVTDGYTDDVPVAGLRQRLAGARIETIALAVGPDADVAALQRLFGTGAGQVLRVNETAELPGVMRSGLDRQRAHIERGAIDVEQPLALPFDPPMLQRWPAVAAHAATRPQAGAVVAVQSRQGDPLIAFGRAGRGRVIAVTCGFGSWSPAWLSWRGWPPLAGGIADWASGASLGGQVGLTVSDLAQQLQVDIDAAAGSDRGTLQHATLEVITPAGRSQALVPDRVAAGLLRATLPEAGAGLYTFVVTTPLGTERHLHLRRQRTEAATGTVDARLDEWRRAELFEAWDARRVAALGQAQSSGRPADRSLVALALTFFLSGVAVDRVRRLTVIGSLTTILPGWRARWPRRRGR